jgi:transcription antitermination factor NusG
MTDQSQWYALVVRHQHERPVERALRYKHLETLVPTYRSRREWSDRTKELELPLFAGYVFCRFRHWERVPVLNVPGVNRIVGFGDGPAAIEDREILELKAVMESKLRARPWPYLKPGDRVQVARGPLRGVEGTLLEDRGMFRLVVGVELLQRSIAVELEPEMVAPAKVYRASV